VCPATQRIYMVKMSTRLTYDSKRAFVERSKSKVDVGLRFPSTTTVGRR